MNRMLPRLTMLVMLVTLASIVTGCATQRLQDERDALYSQNQELQHRLTQTQAALDAEVAGRERVSADLAHAQAELAAKEAADRAAAQQRAATAARRPAAATGGRTTGFSRIANVESFENNGLLTVRVQGDVLFAPGKADLKASSRKTLAQVVKVLQSDYNDNAIRIGGYTDKDPIRKSKWKNNEQLSLARANAVRTYLREKGISASRLFAAGYGSTDLQKTKALSRRVEIVVVLKSGQH